ncbi:MAG: M20/M25/M40 family metallo-hydrolase [Bacteroidota bacterium]
MHKLFTLTTAIFFSTFLSAQVAYSSLVDSLMNDVTEAGISELLEQLSGEVPVMIGGSQYTLETRHSSTTFNPLAAQWIKEQFEAMGLSTEYHYFNSNGENVVATITGSEYPDQQYIICAHYDDMPPGNLAPGADDNASGVVGVLEAARLLKDFDLKYTLKFIAFDEEEQGLIGSYAYAGEASSNGDDILGVLNLDMIAYESNGDMEMSLSTNAQSTPFTNDYTSVLATYGLDLTYNYISIGASDHSPFWNNGYQAILAIEDWDDFNAYYHTVNDLFDNCNIPYFKQMVQSAVATMATHGMDMKMELNHDPLPSGPYTGDRVAGLVVSSNHTVANGENSPRLYYSVDGGAFVELMPEQPVPDTFWFIIPGQGMGSQVDYYFAVQNEDGSLIATLPNGGRGTNPPGTVAPENFFTYTIADINMMTACSNTVPKPIDDMTYLYDTIIVDTEGLVLDLDVQLDLTHTYTGDVEIYLIAPGGEEIALSVAHGGSGDNYTGTTFDDEATSPVSQGTAPFTGSFIPDEPLSTFDNMDMLGYWLLKIYDNAPNDEGMLTNWCLNFTYSDATGIHFLQNAGLVLHQNYPNPFNGETIFSFELPAPDHVNIVIFDMMGRTVDAITDQHFDAGTHSISWHAGNLPQGQYFYRIQTGQYVEVKSMMIAK